MALNGKELGIVNHQKFLDWIAEIKARNIQEFKDYYSPLTGKLNKREIARALGFSSEQPFKDNRAIAQSYDDLIAELRDLKVLPEPSGEKVRVVKEAFSSSDQAKRAQELNHAQNKIAALQEEVRNLKHQLAKYERLDLALSDLTKVIPRE